jgi:hypothetical protein
MEIIISSIAIDSATVAYHYSKVAISLKNTEGPDCDL